MTCTKKELFVLFSLCVFFISSFALINLPSPFENDIINVLNIDTYRYGIIVSLCSWASLLDVVHGYLLDRYLSLSTATWIYVVTIVAGCILYSVAGFMKLYWLLLLGRLIFGFGVNPLVLLCNKHIIIWFGTGKYVNFVYSLCESILWLGSSIDFFITVHIMNSFKSIYTEDEAFAITSALEMGIFTLLTVAPAIILSFMYKYSASYTEKQSNGQSEEDLTSQKKKLGFRDYVCMPFIFWVFSIAVFLFYVSIMSFISMSLLFFVTKYGVSSSYASNLSGAITLVASILSPICGLVLDRIGHNLTAFSVGVILNVLSQALLAFTDCNPIIPVCFMSLSLGFAAGLWSQFQFLVEDHQYMIAYGVAQTGLNGAQAVGTIIAGSVIKTYGNQGFTIFQFLVILCAVPMIALIWFLDYRRGFFMNFTPDKKNAFLGRTKQNTSEKETDNKGEDNKGFS